MNKMYWAIILITLPALCGCSAITVDATCTIDDWTISCRNDKARTQDLPASSEVKDEKPDRPLTRPLQRFEEDAS